MQIQHSPDVRLGGLGQNRPLVNQPEFLVLDCEAYGPNFFVLVLDFTADGLERIVFYKLIDHLHRSIIFVHPTSNQKWSILCASTVLRGLFLSRQ